VTLIDVSRDDFLRAGASSWGLRSADSLHLATALRLDVDEFITYDTELITAARRVGLQVSSPT
ncbi:MAG: type II toxin-antitoxin system VapC family toxin, partial [Mobilicoccus sp.]|nr:type II toxin-antitoxin system VapC family toxin [Mobilicoccus sp.]